MKWLDRELVAGPYLTLATSEAAFQRVLRYLKVPREKWLHWLDDNSLGCMHPLGTTSGRLACVVCVRLGEEEEGIAAATTLIHEAVHVWQAWRRRNGENEPSAEFEAYAIEAISRSLMKEYARQLQART
jgi:hypothetical protein